jgi:hypothetical protein
MVTDLVVLPDGIPPSMCRSPRVIAVCRVTVVCPVSVTVIGRGHRDGRRERAEGIDGHHGC